MDIFKKYSIIKPERKILMKKNKLITVILIFSVAALLIAGLAYMQDSLAASGNAVVSASTASTPSDTDGISHNTAAGEVISLSANVSEDFVSLDPVFEEYDIHLMMVGDNLLHMGVVQTGRQNDGSYDYTCLYEGISDFLDAADISMINQETILGGNELGFSGYPNFNSPTEVGDTLAKVGFDVVLHASNHAADQGGRGLLNCVEFWETEHPEILMVGINGSAPAESDVSTESTAAMEPEYDYTVSANASVLSDTIPIIEAQGVTFAILNYTYGPNMGSIPSDIVGHLNILCAWNESNRYIDYTKLNPQVLEDIRLADELADIVIVCPHWGTEYTTKPSTYQETFAMQMTEAGADLIIGTHPHVIQPVEWITADNGNRALCYYSLGNYVSTQKQCLCMLEAMAWVTFHVTEDSVEIDMEHTGAIPLVCHYTSDPVRVENIYLLEDYTAEQAAAHGIRSYGGVVLYLEDLQNWSNEVLSENAIPAETALGD